MSRTMKFCGAAALAALLASCETPTTLPEQNQLQAPGAAFTVYRNPNGSGCSLTTFGGGFYSLGTIPGVFAGDPDISFSGAWYGFQGTASLVFAPSGSVYFSPAAGSVSADFYQFESFTVTAFEGGNAVPAADVQVSGGTITVSHSVDQITITQQNVGKFGFYDLNVCSGANQAPVAVAGDDQSHECAGTAGNQVTLDGSASYDPDGTVASYQWTDENGNVVSTAATADVTVPLGSHTYTLTVTDDKGATGTDSVDVNIVDTTPPVASLSVSPENIWPANHKYVELSVDASATDLCCGTPTLSASIATNEPDNTRKKGDGNTAGDIRVTHADGTVVYSTNDLETLTFNPATDKVEVRAERQGNGSGRIYTVTLSATDDAGNVGTATAQVAVAHDQGKRN